MCLHDARLPILEKRKQLAYFKISVATANNEILLTMAKCVRIRIRQKSVERVLDPFLWCCSTMQELCLKLVLIRKIVEFVSKIRLVALFLPQSVPQNRQTEENESK